MEYIYIYVCQIESGEKTSGSQRLVLRGHLIVIQNKVEGFYLKKNPKKPNYFILFYCLIY